MAARIKTVSGKWNLTSKTRAISTRVGLSSAVSLRDAAQAEGVTISDIIKRAIDRELERVLSTSGEDAGATVG